MLVLTDAAVENKNIIIMLKHYKVAVDLFCADGKSMYTVCNTVQDEE